MAMEPVLLVCGGCGVRIRTIDPAKARARACPRCESSLGPAVDRALGVDPDRPVEVDPGSRVASGPWPLRQAAGLVVVVVLVGIGALASFAVRGSSPGLKVPGRDSSPLVSARTKPVPASSPTKATSPTDQPDQEDETESGPPVAELTAPPPSPRKEFAILEPNNRDNSSILRSHVVPRHQPTPLDQSPPRPPSSAARTDPPTEPRRIVVRDKKGRAIVAREHGIVKDRLTVILPDGQIGWLDDQVITSDPFVPATMEEMRRTLLDDPEFAAFRLHQTAHYLILFQSKTDAFAKASGELLEKLHDGLTGALRKNGLPVQPMEFPLVAVIFETEADFRANRRVPPDVQAYYEILSNRIYFYEKSRRDQDAPEVSALRKPQTVAHEGTHQILHNVGIQPRMSDWPLWLVEGLAEYCSPPKVTKKGVDWAGLGQVNSLHMATIRDLDDPLPNQFHGGPRQPIVPRDRGKSLVEYLVTQKELTPTDYALSWALTHYLAKMRTADFVDYIKRMSQLKPGQEQAPQEKLAIFREVFGADLAQMDGKVGKYLKNLKSPDVLPFYAVIFEQQVGAMIRRQAMVSQSPSMIREWIGAVTIPQGVEPHWQCIPHPNRNKAIEAVEHWMREGN
jgi:Protein of unknown function (DUF1570)